MTDDPAAAGVLDAALGVLAPRVARLRFRARDPVRVTRPAASAWRGALGASLLRRCSERALPLAWEGEGPPALWFRAWQGFDAKPGEASEVELVVLGSAMSQWDCLLLALGELVLNGGRLTLEQVSWVETPPVRPVAGSGGGADLVTAAEVVALSPLQLRHRGRAVSGLPPLELLVRSAGERLRQLDERWGHADLALPSVVGTAVRACGDALRPSGTSTSAGAARRSGHSGDRHVVSGTLGSWLYVQPPPEALPWLHAGAVLGIGKGVALGAGRYELQVSR